MKEIAVIGWHTSIGRFSGYSSAFGLYYFLSNKFKINLIVPREYNIFSEEVQYINPNMTKREVCLDVPEKDYTDHLMFYKSIAENITEQDKKKLENAIADSDLIICDAIYWVSLIKSIFPDRQIIFRSLDVEYDKALWYSKLHSKSSLLVKSSYEFEKKAYHDADLVFALTQNDVERLAELYQISLNKFRVIPICSVNADIISKYVPNKREKNKLTKGLLISAAAIDHSETILNKIGTIKNFELHIVGRAGMMLENVPANVILHGIISEKEKNDLLAECDFALNISEMTFGMNIKMSDYFSSGIPVLSNKLGVRGYNVQENVHYFPCTLETLENDIVAFCDMDIEKRYELAINAFKNYCSYNNYNNYVHLFSENLDCKEDMTTCFIFGAGICGKNALSELSSNNYRCIGFIDNNAKRQGELYLGKTVYSFSEALKVIKSSPEKIKIVIAVSFLYVEEIYKQVSVNVKTEDIEIFEYF